MQTYGRSARPPPAYLPRALEPILLRAATALAVVVLTGPRQSGKTTLLWTRSLARARLAIT